MTGRRLYEHFCDSARETTSVWPATTALPGGRDNAPPVAWPYLPARDKRLWGDLARRITPNTKRRSS